MWENIDFYPLKYAKSPTNGIENLFSTLRHREKNLKNYSPMYRGKPVKKDISQRWLATVFLKAEKGFRRVKGYKEIPTVIASVKKLHEQIIDMETKKAA